MTVNAALLKLGVGPNIIPFQFRDGVFAIVSFRLQLQHICIIPVHLAPRSRATNLQAGSPVKHDQYVLAQGFRLLFLSFAQSFSRCHHQHDGNDPPGDPEHCEECAQLVCHRVRSTSPMRSRRTIAVMDAAALRT